MATKYEIKKFLERKSLESLAEIQKEYDEKQNEAVKTFCFNHKADLLAVRNALTTLDSDMHVFIKNIKTDGSASMLNRYGNNPEYLINELFECFTVSGISKKFSINSTEKLKQQHEKTANDTKHEYQRLIALTQSIGAKEGLALLKSLGFETSELELEKQATALITNIDAKKLHIVLGGNE